MATTAQAYRNAIRFYLSDTSETNVLLGEEESSDARIDLAMMMVIDEFQIYDPLDASYTINNFPSFSIMISGSVIHLLKMAGILHSRNALNYNAGGLSVQIWNKAKDYQSWIGALQQDYRAQMMHLAKKLNIAYAMAQCPMGLHTEYFLAGFRLPGLIT